jgi:hypothetical protein
MLMKVKGTIQRTYVSGMSHAFQHIAGTYYKPIDADGAFSGSYCHGEIRTDFRVFGFVEYTLRSCGLSYNNNDGDNLIVSETIVVGRLKGSGSVMRTGMNQPTWPGWYNCLNGPCIKAAEGSQTITMHPWMDRLSLAASPTTVFEGDSVTFTPSATGGVTIASGSQRWSWVAHDREISGTVVPTPTDTQTGTCANGTAICKVRVFKTGNMFVKANLNPGTHTEQAFAKVVVKPLQLIATPVPRAVGGALDSVKVEVRTVPHRELSSISVVITPTIMALRAGSFSSAGSATCDPGTGECELSGGTAPSTLTVTATTVQGVTLTTTVEVEQILCPTGDPTLDNPTMRDLLKNLERLGLAAIPPKEFAGVVVRDSLGVESWVIDSTNASNNCHSAGFNVALLPPGTTPIHTAHYHPGAPNDPVPCEANKVYSRGWRRGLPSPADWHVSEQVGGRSVVIDPKGLASYGGVPLSDSTRVRVKGGGWTWVKVPTKNEFNNNYTEVSRSGPGCTRP